MARVHQLLQPGDPGSAAATTIAIGMDLKQDQNACSWRIARNFVATRRMSRRKPAGTLKKLDIVFVGRSSSLVEAWG
jgi:hypothetical protein